MKFFLPKMLSKNQQDDFIKKDLFTMQIIGYVYSKKEKRLVAIESEKKVETNLEEKVFTYFKEQVERKIKGGNKANENNIRG